MLKQKQPIYQMQTDLKWAKIPYTSCNDKTQTIASSGCGLTSSCMMLDEFLGLKLTPVDLAKLSLNNGFRTKDQGTSWGFYSFLAKKYNLKFEQTTDLNEVKSAIVQNALVICSMGRKSVSERGFFTSSGHYILLWGISDDNHYYANDPISKYRTNIPVDEEVFKTQCKQFFIFYRPVISKPVVVVPVKPKTVTKVVLADSLNIREQADKNSKKLGELTKNTKVEVYQITKNNFAEIRINGKVAYVSNQYLK